MRTTTFKIKLPIKYKENGNQNAVAVVLETKSEKEDISKDKWKQELVKPA